jgi:glutamate synthase (NADPH/NADH) small chain
MISQKNELGAAGKILAENIMGGTCARACPVETLCEHACVRNGEESGPVKIGLLQRFATDQASLAGAEFFTRGQASGHRVAIIGAGPAGLSCAHRLAVLGHEVVIYEAQQKSGGLNEYGLAAYKMVDDYAQREVEAILSIGGISIRNGVKVGQDISLAELQISYDAVFMGVGLGINNALQIDGEQAHGVLSAVNYIHRLRQAKDLSELPVGQDMVVIGGGMTAIDIAVQTKRLGANNVSIVYRRGKDNMSASLEEQELALKEGVRIVYWAQPVSLQIEKNVLTGVTFKSTNSAEAENFTMPADMLFKAIGQSLAPIDTDIPQFTTMQGKIAVDAEQRTSHMGIWAGGDCVSGGDDLTVSAVQDGKVAALSIHNTLTQPTA